MEMNTILSAVSKMFPSANLNGAVQKAQEMIQGTPDNLAGVSSVAHRMGIDQQTIDSIFRKYGNTIQARAICSMLGTTPEALKADADKIIGNVSKSQDIAPQIKSVSSSVKRFPRLK